MSYTFVVSNCGNNGQIKTKFNPPLQLDPYKQYEMALVNLETYWSFPNVTEENDLFKFSDTKNTYDIFIPKGAYELERINAYIQRKLINLGFKEDTITLTANLNTLKCVMKVSKGFSVDFTSNIAIGSKMLGFERTIFTAKDKDTTFEAKDIVKIININSIYVHNNLIGHSYIDGSLSPVIYSFFPTTGVGEKIVEKPRKLVYSPVTLSTINSMQTWITDQNDKDLDLQGESLTIRFHLREVANIYLEQMVKLMQK